MYAPGLRHTFIEVTMTHPFKVGDVIQRLPIKLGMRTNVRCATYCVYRIFENGDAILKAHPGPNRTYIVTADKLMNEFILLNP